MAVAIQKIHNMVIAKSQGQGMEQQLVTIAMTAMRCTEDIVYEDVSPMDTGLGMHHDAGR